MLRHTFLHIPGIGPVTERRLWERGAVSWEECLRDDMMKGLSPSLARRLARPLTDSAKALASRNACRLRYTSPRMPP